MGVGIRSCLLNRVAFLGVGLLVVLLWFVGMTLGAGKQGHVEARCRLRRRAVFDRGMGLRGFFLLEWVVVLWVVGKCLSLSNIGCLCPMWSQSVWFRGWAGGYH